MNTFPSTLEAAIEQAKEATKSAIADGYKLVQVELVIPEIALQSESLALQFAHLFADDGTKVKVMFPDTGAAALAKRNWGDKPFSVTDMGSRFTPIETQVSPEDEMFIVACPSSVEVDRAEKLSKIAEDRPVIFLIPQLEDVAVVGIGLAARQLRERFIKNIYSSYHLRPIDGGAVLRCHPSQWQVWLENEEKEENYELATELAVKPVGEDLDRLVMELISSSGEDKDGDRPKKKQNKNILGSLQKFLKALSQ